MHFQAGFNEAEQRIEGTEKALGAYVTHLMGDGGGPSLTSSPAPRMVPASRISSPPRPPACEETSSAKRS